MKTLFLFLLLLISSLCSAQIIVSGKVLHLNKPLEGAAVYFNNTMIGTTTNSEGEFAIKVSEGKHELIISFLGFKTINYSLNTANFKNPLVFNLKEEESVLDEIVLRQIKYDDKWNFNFFKFRREFIGTTKFSKDCIILNPKVLFFEYDTKKSTLNAYARKPLKIKHNSLGYNITYDLVGFTINKNMVSYLGYSRYEKIKGTKKQQKRWRKNRLKVYKGSNVHFFKSLINNRLKKEGYQVNQFRRVLNSKRPSESEIKKARVLIRKYRKSINFSKEIYKPKTVLDSAIVTLKEARLPKFKDYLYKSKLKENEILKIKNDSIFLTFNDNLSIMYKKEKEERNYLLKESIATKRIPQAQTSSLIPIKRPLILDKTGVLINPLSIYYEGYWSFEKFANTLPLDYKPPVKRK